MGQIAVIRHQQQSLAGIVQSSDWIDSSLDAAHQIHHCRPLFWIAYRRDITLGFIQKQIRMPLFALQQLPIDADVVHLGISFAAEFRDHRPVHLHMPGRDQFLSFSPGSDTSRRDYFLQPLEGHIERPCVFAMVKERSFQDRVRESALLLEVPSRPETFNPPFLPREHSLRKPSPSEHHSGPLELRPPPARSLPESNPPGTTQPPAFRIPPCWATRSHP